VTPNVSGWLPFLNVDGAGPLKEAPDKHVDRKLNFTIRHVTLRRLDGWATSETPAR
jgi:hypothetical protein